MCVCVIHSVGWFGSVRDVWRDVDVLTVSVRRRAVGRSGRSGGGGLGIFYIMCKQCVAAAASARQQKSKPGPVYVIVKMYNFDYYARM